MRILVLQLKRIGDLILTTPALAALRAGLPDAHVTLAVHTSTAGLLPMIEDLQSGIVFGPGRGWAPWQQVLTGRFDVVLDLTGTDRSAAAVFLSRAHRRIAFDWVRKKRVRALVFNEFVASSVRDRHTVDHYLDLVQPLLSGAAVVAPIQPRLRLPDGEAVGGGKAVVLHPGTARPEKYWLAERWVEVARYLAEKHGRDVVITTGPDVAERAHAEAIRAGAAHPRVTLAAPADLAAFAKVLAGAPLVLSCDTSAVHLAAAFGRLQVALFGPTNPFHWRPRHARALVLSAADPDAPMSDFAPRMKGAPMDRISTAAVCRAIDSLLASTQ